MTVSSSSSSSDAGNDGSGNGSDIPYHLMPIAAICAMYAVGATIRALYQIYRNVVHDPSKVTSEMKLRGHVPKPLKSRQFVVLVASIVAAVLAYGYVTALVDNSIAASDIFDRKYCSTTFLLLLVVVSEAVADTPSTYPLLHYITCHTMINTERIFPRICISLSLPHSLP